MAQFAEVLRLGNILSITYYRFIMTISYMNMYIYKLHESILCFTFLVIWGQIRYKVRHSGFIFMIICSLWTIFLFHNIRCEQKRKFSHWVCRFLIDFLLRSTCQVLHNLAMFMNVVLWAALGLWSRDMISWIKPCHRNAALWNLRHPEAIDNFAHKNLTE